LVLLCNVFKKNCSFTKQNKKEMKKILFFTLVSLLTFSLNVSAKAKSASPEAKTEVAVEVSNTVLKGVVFDKLTNESLAGAVVSANGQKVYTDLDGNFTVQNVCEGKCQLKISMISYEDQIIDVDSRNFKSVQIKLSQR
jgi:hypothetical protein